MVLASDACRARVVSALFSSFSAFPAFPAFPAFGLRETEMPAGLLPQIASFRAPLLCNARQDSSYPPPSSARVLGDYNREARLNGVGFGSLSLDGRVVVVELEIGIQLSWMGSMLKQTARQGFTLVELLTVVVVLAVITSIALPAMRSLIDRQRLKSVVETLQSDLRAARTEALVVGVSGSVTVTLNYASSGQTWSYSIASSGSAPTFERSQDDYAGDITATVTGWGATSSSASFTLTPVRRLDSTGVGTITFTNGALSATVERNLLGSVFVCSANSDLGYGQCS